MHLQVQCAHQEIKSHGQTIKSIVSICEQFSSSASHSSSHSSSRSHHNNSRHNSRTTSSGGASQNNQDVGRAIERRWHCLWLRSLEWQCYLEQLTWSPTITKKQSKNLPSSEEEELCHNNISDDTDLRIKAGFSIEALLTSATKSDNNATRYTGGGGGGHSAVSATSTPIKPTVAASGDQKLLKTPHHTTNTAISPIQSKPKLVRKSRKSRKTNCNKKSSTMNSSCCSSESSSSLTSASMTSSMTSSNSQQEVGDPTMSTSNSMHHGDMRRLENEDSKEADEKSSCDSETSLASLNREMRMLIRMATSSPSDPMSKFNNNAKAGGAESPMQLSNCQTTFSRKMPNCGTYFFKHISSSEDEDSNMVNNNSSSNHRSSINGSMISSSSPTPRLEDPLGPEISPLVLTSSPLKTSDSEPPLFDEEALHELDDEDLDNLIHAEEQKQQELNVEGGQQRAKVSCIADANGRRIPVLDFSGIHPDEDEDAAETEEQAQARRELEAFRKNSIKKLVGDAEKLLFQTVSFSTDDSADEGHHDVRDVDDPHTVSASELSMYRTKSSSILASRYKRSHSFHNYGTSTSSPPHQQPAGQPTVARGDGCEASGEEGTSNAPESSCEDDDDDDDESVQDAEMKSQHNQSAYSLVLVDSLTSSSPNDSPVHSPKKTENDSTLKNDQEEEPAAESPNIKIRVKPPPQPTEAVAAAAPTEPSVKVKRPKHKNTSRLMAAAAGPGPQGGRSSVSSGAAPGSDDEEGELAEYWDQEKYLSEHNYDEPIDVDKALKLLNFGDDYRNFIGSGGSDFSDINYGRVPTSGQSSANNKSGSAKNRRKLRRSANRGATAVTSSANGGVLHASTAAASALAHNQYDSQSETEMDDVWRTVLESRTKLNEVKRRFRNCQQGCPSPEEDDESDDMSTTAAAASSSSTAAATASGKESHKEGGNAASVADQEKDFTEELMELKGICKDNVDCICKLLEDNTEKNGTVILKKTERSFKGLLRQWQDVMHLIIKRLELSETLSKIMSDIKRLEEQVGKVLMGRPPPPVMHNKEDLQKDIEGLKGSVVHLTGLKSDLFNVNVEIHNFLADLCVTRRKDSHHSPPQHRIPILRRETITSTSLRDKVVALYALWDEAFHRISSQLANSQSTYAKLLQFETESHRLAQIMEQTQLLRRTKRNSAYLTEDSGISEGSSENNEREEALFTKLKALAQDLESKLTPQSTIMQEITQCLKSSATELEESGRLSRLSSIVEPEKSAETSSGSHGVKAVSRATSTDEAENRLGDVEEEPPRRGFWRKMMRATVPIQAVFLSSLIMSWVLDPENGAGQCNGAGGSDLLNALYPQLRYLNGPPPI